MQLFNSTVEELIFLLVRSMKRVLKGCPYCEGGEVQHKQKCNVDFNSWHQLQIKCWFIEQMSVYMEELGKNTENCQVAQVWESPS